MKVLFAIGQNTDTTIQDKVLSTYKEIYNQEFNYECEYYIDGVVKYLSENDVDVLVLNELLENQPVDIQILDNITDQYPDLKVILGIDNKHKEDDFTNRLYALGLYNCLFFSDFTVDKLVEVLKTGRTKKQAKDYYEIEDDSIDIQFQVSPISDDVLRTTVNALHESIIEGNINEIFSEVDKEFNEKEMCYLLTVLPVKIVEELQRTKDKTYSKYSEIIHKQVETQKQIEIQYIEKPIYVEKEVEVEKLVEVEKIIEKEVEVEKVVEKIVEKEKPVIVEKEVFKVNKVRYESVITLISNAPTGKSYLAWNLAYALSENYKVAIINIDRYSMCNSLFGTIDREVALSDIEHKSIKDIVGDGIIINENITLYSGQFGTRSDINKTMLSQLITSLKSENNIVIIDTETGFNNNLGKILSLTNDVLVVYSIANGHIRLNDMLMDRLDDELYCKNVIAVLNNVYKESSELKSVRTYIKKLKKFNNIVEVSHAGKNTYEYMNTKDCNYIKENNEFTNDIDALISTLKLQGKQNKKKSRKSIFNIITRR